MLEISVPGYVYQYFNWQKVFNNTDVAVTNVVAILKMFLSGQLVLLRSMYNKKPCAYELAIKSSEESFTTLPSLTTTQYSWKMQDTGKSYTCDVLHNNASKAIVKNIDTLQLISDLMVRGRQVSSNNPFPLTKELNAYTNTEEYWKALGKDDDTSAFTYRIQSWEYWLSMLLVGSAWLGYVTSSHAPKFIKDHSVTSILVLGIGSEILFTLFMLYKRRVKNKVILSVWKSIDRFFRLNTALNMLGFVSVILLLAIFLPAYVDKITGQNITFVELIKQHTWLVVVPCLYLLQTLLSFTKAGRNRKLLLAISTLASSVLLMYANIKYTNSDATLESNLVDTLVSLSWLLSCILGLTLFIGYMAKLFTNKTKSDKSNKLFKDYSRLVIITCYITSVSLCCASLIMLRELPPSSTRFGHPGLLSICIFIVAILYTLLPSLYIKKKINRLVFQYSAGALFFVCLLLSIFFVTDDQNEGPWQAWVLLIGSAFINLASVALLEVTAGANDVRKAVEKSKLKNSGKKLQK